MSFNVTAPIHHSVELLYANVDTFKLSWLEQMWMRWYIWIGDPTIATGLMSFLFHEVTYFGRCLPWMVIDAIPYFRRWKLQPDKIPTKQEQWECTKLLLYSHFTIELPQIWFFHPVAEYFGLSTWQVPFPPLKTMLGQIAVFMVFEDAFHYFSHRALHYGPMYRYIHKLHHRFSAPFGLAAEYAHPAEVFILGTGTIGGPLLYCWLMGNLHIITVYFWILLRLFQAVDAHSGYDFPWSLRNFFPLWSGAEHHDFHHMAFVNNYSTSFRYLDYLFGTDDKYRAYRAKVNAARIGKKYATKEEVMEAQKRMLEETEREGAVAAAKTEKAGSDWMLSTSPTKAKAQS